MFIKYTFSFNFLHDCTVILLVCRVINPLMIEFCYNIFCTYYNKIRLYTILGQPSYLMQCTVLKGTSITTFVWSQFLWINYNLTPPTIIFMTSHFYFYLVMRNAMFLPVCLFLPDVLLGSLWYMPVYPKKWLKTF